MLSQINSRPAAVFCWKWKSFCFLIREMNNFDSSNTIFGGTMKLRQLKVNKSWNKTAYLEYIHRKLLNCHHQSPKGFERNYANIRFMIKSISSVNTVLQMWIKAAIYIISDHQLQASGTLWWRYSSHKLKRERRWRVRLKSSVEYNSSALSGLRWTHLSGYDEHIGHGQRF